MKKLVIILVSALFAINVNAQTTAPAYNVPNEQEKKFDYMYTAYGSTVDKNGSVSLIPELLTGKFPMKYRGMPNPTITGIPPTLTGGKFIEFINRPHTSYASDAFETLYPPFEVWLVSYNDFGQPYEVKLPGSGGSPYLADNGEGVRFMHSAYNLKVKQPPNYKITIERLVVKNGYGYYYQDGVLKDSVKIKPEDLPIARSYNGIGVETNNKDWHFAALYVKSTVVSPQDAAQIYKSLAVKWKVGTYPNHALISRISWDRNGDVAKAGTTWAPHVDYQSIPKNVLLAPFKDFKFEWYYNTDNFRKQVTFSNKMIITRADFPEGWDKMNGFNIGLRITPKYKNGTYGIKFSGKTGDYRSNDFW